MAAISIARPATPFRRSFTLTKKEQEKYSLARAILSHSDNLDGHAAQSFELEVSDELAKQRPENVKYHGGIYIPWAIQIDAAGTRRIDTDRVRAGLDTKASTKGQEVVFVEPQSFIEYLYSRMVVKDLGAVTLSGLHGNLAFPKQTGKASGSWVLENPGVEVADSNLTLGQIIMSPKTYQSSTSYSRQLLAQASTVIDVDNLVRGDLAADSALAFDKAALVGDGTGGSPMGILSTAGTQVYTMAADTGTGGKPTYADVTGMEELIEEVNADTLGGYGWVTVPSIKAVFRQTAKLGNTIAQPVWDEDGTIDGYTAKITNQLPKNLTKGAGTNLTVLLLGIWNQLILGTWGNGYELVVDPYSNKKQGMIELTSFVMSDVGIRQPTAFAYSKAVAKS